MAMQSIEKYNRRKLFRFLEKLKEKKFDERKNRQKKIHKKKTLKI
jgi:hypothetical protein